MISSWIHLALPGVLYAGLIIVVLVAAAGRPMWALVLMAIFIPLPNVWYQLHQFPLGRSTMDLLILATLIGTKWKYGTIETPPRAAMFICFVLMVYMSLWKTTFLFALPPPVTLDNPFLSDFKNYAEMLFLYFVAYNVLRTEVAQQRLVVVMTVIVLLLAAREARGFTVHSAFSYGNRATGPFWIAGLNSNHFGAFLAYMGSLLVALFICDRHRIRRWLYLGTTIACIQPLFYAYSRGSYLAAVAGLAVIGLLRSKVIVLLVVVLAFTWQVVLPASVVDRITMTETPSGQIEMSAAQRFELWERAKELFAENPVIGIGYRAIRLAVSYEGLSNVHSLYMETAAEQGVVGLLFLAYILARAMTSGWILYRGERSGFLRGLGLGFLAATFAVAISNLFGDRWSQFPLGAYFFILWGMVDRGYALTPSVKSADATGPTTRARLRGPARRLAAR